MPVEFTSVAVQGEGKLIFFSLNMMHLTSVSKINELGWVTFFSMAKFWYFGNNKGLKGFLVDCWHHHGFFNKTWNRAYFFAASSASFFLHSLSNRS